jgi:hypothetical protein
MTRILETRLKKQQSSEYSRRYQILVVSGKYFYEFIYRFSNEERSHMTVTRSTFGHIHETQSGRTLVLENEPAILRHAKKIVHNMEKETIKPEEAAA